MLQCTKPLLFGDTLGIFHCSVCNQSAETFERKPSSWATIVHLVLYNLIRNAQLDNAKKAKKDRRDHFFFRWKEDVCAFIDDYWDYLCPEKQRTTAWHNTIASVLSTHSNIFLSGLEKLKQSAWWTLRKIEPPAAANAIDKKPNHRAKPTLEKPLKRSSIKLQESKRPAKRRKKAKLTATKPDLDNDSMDMSSLSELSSTEEILSDTEGIKIKDEPNLEIIEQASVSSPTKEPAAVKSETVAALREDSFDLYTPSIPTSALASANIQQATFTTSSSSTSNLSLTSQDEWLLLQKLEHSSKKLTPAACRYKRKLGMRRLKRNLGIKLFDMDTHLVNLLRTPSHKLEAISKETTIQPASNHQRVEQQQDNQLLLDKITWTPYTCSFASRLYGSIRQRNTMTRDEPWLSSWNGRKLRPFIRRDFQSKPKRMLLMGQIKACKGRTPKKLGAEPSGIAVCESIDYVYFQKEHLQQVNMLLSRSFWEGVDVSESLLFPEFSIVALYKRRVIGCAFMTPEAYITYFAVEPGWTNASIGQFMLYHLFQTAISKDITLHVSANNNAMILYQKFGFKPEEFIVNFYDKYLPTDSVFSKNAFFLRLRR
ncbi:hypothetical protein [Parasitella parasitica]|uniref:N-acetyltransferase domain-containing protein n=1 Tax=Parasitella parasitica TaxID=35722 RepID=A0A0B7NLT2_9FUNG|nr:hypothetical protein [Parasitella parasitica]